MPTHTHSQAITQFLTFQPSSNYQHTTQSPELLSPQPSTLLQQQSPIPYIPKPPAQPSVLTFLQQSLNHKPSFQQVFLLQQQKKHLWQLLALKEEAIQKLEEKVKQDEKQKDLWGKELSKRQLVISQLTERSNKLEKQLRKVLQIKENIIEEMNLLKLAFTQHVKGAPINENNQRPQQQNAKMLPFVPLVNTQTDFSMQSSLLKQNTKLKQQNSSLAQKNALLKEELNLVLQELREIKVDVVERFYLRKVDHQEISHPPEKRPIQTEIIHLNQKPFSSTRKRKASQNSTHQKNEQNSISKKSGKENTFKQNLPQPFKKRQTSAFEKPSYCLIPKSQRKDKNKKIQPSISNNSFRNNHDSQRSSIARKDLNLFNALRQLPPR